MRSNPDATARGPARLAGICAGVATGGGFLLLLGAMLALGMSRGMNHDESQHLAAGAVFGRRLLLPYRDFPYFHMPDLVLLYGVLFRWCGRILLAARLVSGAAGWLTAVLVWAMVRRECREKGAVLGWLLPAAATALLVSNPIFRETYWRTWNHALAMLFAVAAVMAALRGGRGWGWAGVLLGLAIGTRVSFAPLFAPLAAAAMLEPGAKEMRERMKKAGIFCGGAAAGLLPAVVFFAMAPAQFIFGVFTFNSKVNVLFRQSHLDPRITLLAKLLFPFKEILLADRSNALLAALFVAVVVAGIARVSRLQPGLRYRLLVVLGLIPFALMGAVAASPSQKEYYYPVAPLMVLAIGMAAGGLVSAGRGRWIWRALIPAAALVATRWGWHQYPGLRLLETPSEWTTGPIHGAGVQLRRWVPAGRVLTLEPMEPLEGGLDIYPSLVTGGIAWRCERFVKPEDREKLGILGPDNFAAAMEQAPPAGVLTNPRSAMDQPLVDWARAHGYAEHPVEAWGKLVDPAVLWVRPGARPGR